MTNKKGAVDQEKILEFRQKEEERLVQLIAERNNLEYTDGSVVVEADALLLAKEEDAVLGNFVIFKRFKKEVYIAVRDLRNTKYLETVLDLEKRGFVVKEYMAAKHIILKLQKYYKDFSRASRAEMGSLKVSAEVVERLASEITSVDIFEKEFQKTLSGQGTHYVSRLLELMIGGALGLRSSDIHIEPFDKDIFIRFRIDGVLRKVASLDLNTFKKITARLKLIAGLKINLTDIAQDGRYTLKLPKRKVEVRLSIVPGPAGESTVMRLLDPENVVVGIEKLGLHHSLSELFNSAIRKPTGMIVTTGPTGSGKTSTLYAFLNEIYTPEIKIFTLEDPVEYKLTGVVQTQISKNYTFAKGLRAALRQDPDVVLVGEIRDAEVAKTAIDAALTGHVVFSTLHTNDAAGALPRLVEMGINPKTISSALNLIIAQRLVRKLCPDCREEEVLTKERQAVLDKIIKDMPKPIQQEINDLSPCHIYKPPKDTSGCKNCSDGYHGLIGIFEAIVVNLEFEKILVSGGGTIEIKEAMKSQNLMTLAEDCLLKVIKNITTLDEMLRVAGVKI